MDGSHILTEGRLASVKKTFLLDSFICILAKYQISIRHYTALLMLHYTALLMFTVLPGVYFAPWCNLLALRRANYVVEDAN